MLNEKRVTAVAERLNVQFRIIFIPDAIEVAALKAPVRAISAALTALLPPEMIDMIEKLEPNAELVDYKKAGDFIVNLIEELASTIPIPFFPQDLRREIIKCVVEIIIGSMSSVDSLGKYIAKQL